MSVILNLILSFMVLSDLLSWKSGKVVGGRPNLMQAPGSRLVFCIGTGLNEPDICMEWIRT